MFCDINIKRKNNNIEVKDKMGRDSVLYPKILEYARSNDVLSGREYFFKQLVSQGKLKSYTPEELALGLYSVAWHTDKTEGYWSSKIDRLLPPVKESIPEIRNAFVPAEKLYENFISEHSYGVDEVLPMLDKSEYYRELARELIRFNPKLKVVFSSDIRQSVIDQLMDNDTDINTLEKVYNNLDDSTDGVAVHPLNTAMIKDNAPSRVVVHEIVHLTIQKQYESDKVFRTQINKLFDITEKYIVDNKLDSPYGITNENEFMAEGLSNPEFMKFLNEIPSGNTSVWSEFMSLVSNFINQIFNVGVNPNSVFAELTNNVNQVIQNNKSETNIDDLSSMVTSFSEYFPQYEWLSEEEKQIVIDLVDQGKLELSCKI